MHLSWPSFELEDLQSIGSDFARYSNSLWLVNSFKTLQLSSASQYCLESKHSAKITLVEMLHMLIMP